MVQSFDCINSILLYSLPLSKSTGQCANNLDRRFCQTQGGDAGELAVPNYTLHDARIQNLIGRFGPDHQVCSPIECLEVEEPLHKPPQWN
jgi:hypothetical protein